MDLDDQADDLPARTNRPNRSAETLLAEGAAEVMRDLGHVMFCPACKRAEMPGAMRCGKCGGEVGRVRKPAKARAVAEAA